MANQLINLVDENEYKKLFVAELGWNLPDLRPTTVSLEESTYHLSQVAGYKGLRVWVCPEIPGKSTQAAIDRAVSKLSNERLVIFHDDTEQVWRWPVRSVKKGTSTSRLASHIHQNGQDNPKLVTRLETIAIGIDEDLTVNGLVDRMREAFDVETSKESAHASKLMASMYDALHEAGAGEHTISVTLARLIFLLFGDDTDMWIPDLFETLIAYETAPDGSDLDEKLNELFAYLDTPPSQRTETTAPYLSKFKYVNGGLFEERITLPTVGKKLRDSLLEASRMSWGDISPAIFGSMFQSVRDAQTRRELGEHYTSEKDILKTIKPLFLDELYERFEAAKQMKNESLALRKLWAHLGDIRFMDPACGCGNFIIIAYRELRELELRIMERLQELSGQTQLIMDPTLELKVTLDHFYGIEIDEWPARIAETAMFLIDRQCDLRMLDRFGIAPDRLPIQRQATIITATQGNPNGGNALLADWKKVLPPSDSVIIAGNPPYLGQKEKSPSQRAEMRLVWGDEYDGYLDYVTGWYAQALNYFAKTDNGRFAFVSTNSIVQGQPVAALFDPIFSRGWRIRFAHRTFSWQSDASGGAAVHCVILGFDKLTGPVRVFDYPDLKGEPVEATATQLNAYLIEGRPVSVRKRSSPLSRSVPPVSVGSKASDWGYLTVMPEYYADALSDPAGKFLRPYVGGDELINDLPRWCFWLEDVSLSDCDSSPMLRYRLAEVKSKRLESGKAATRALASTPHLFSERRQPTQDYLGIPNTFSENRIYATAKRLPPDVIAAVKLFTAPDPDGFLFGLISSIWFITWQKMVGGRLKSDPSFSNTLVWNNFPVPNVVSDPQRQAVIAAGQEVMAVRARYPDKSLAVLYKSGAMADDLLAAHRDLDLAVGELFGQKRLVEAEIQRQRLLFEKYLSLAGENAKPFVGAPRRQRTPKGASDDPPA